jgi:hypothetical protein
LPGNRGENLQLEVVTRWAEMEAERKDRGCMLGCHTPCVCEPDPSLHPPPVKQEGVAMGAGSVLISLALTTPRDMGQKALCCAGRISWLLGNVREAGTLGRK